MFCNHCGKEIPDEAVICPHCGCQIKSLQPAQKTSNSAKTLAIVGFILSFFISLAGLIVSIVALNKYKVQTDQSGKGLAKAGLIISIVWMALVFLATISRMM